MVWKVIWAYPEFGQVLATCSYDRTVAVWEELREYLSLVIYILVIFINFLFIYNLHFSSIFLSSNSSFLEFIIFKFIISGSITVLLKILNF